MFPAWWFCIIVVPSRPRLTSRGFWAKDWNCAGRFAWQVPPRAGQTQAAFSGVCSNLFQLDSDQILDDSAMPISSYNMIPGKKMSLKSSRQRRDVWRYSFLKFFLLADLNQVWPSSNLTQLRKRLNVSLLYMFQGHQSPVKMMHLPCFFSFFHVVSQ